MGLVLNPSLAANAKQIFTGDDIVDGSLTGADVRNGSLKAEDIDVSTLPSGGDGESAAGTLHKWTFSHVENGELRVLGTSTDAVDIPAGRPSWKAST